MIEMWIRRFELVNRLNGQHQDTGKTWTENGQKHSKNKTPFTDVNAHISKREQHYIEAISLIEHYYTLITRIIRIQNCLHVKHYYFINFVEGL